MYLIYALLILLCIANYYDNPANDSAIQQLNSVEMTPEMREKLDKILQADNFKNEEQKKEENPPIGLILGIVGILFLGILGLIWKIVSTIFQKQINRVLFLIMYLPSRQESETIHDYLYDNSGFYKNLSEENRKKFIRRFYLFYKIKNFEFTYDEPNEGKIIYIVCATITQMTFGFNDYYLFNFNQFNLYPDKYYLPQADADAYGHTSEGGIIYISTKKLIEGIAIENDGDNILMHELAHAIYLQKSDFDYNRRYLKIYDLWKTFAKIYMDRETKDKSVFLGEYAFSNIDEMLAVNTEFFFEKPLDCKKNLPEMYFFMKYMYNQDPVNRQEPVVTEKFLMRNMWSAFEIENQSLKTEHIKQGIFKVKLYEQIVYTGQFLGGLIVLVCPLILLLFNRLDLYVYFISIYVSAAIFIKLYLDRDLYQFFNPTEHPREVFFIVVKQNALTILFNLIILLISIYVHYHSLDFRSY